MSRDVNLFLEDMQMACEKGYPVCQGFETETVP